MDSQSVLARFEAERQALALMDHPNIAKVFDGGMTEQGRPYFVMEYVKGVPITEYCDQRAAARPRNDCSCSCQVCQAVQHAHQKGIIHRDLKPSNILVALYDGKPVPKVIDFGVAKAMHQSLTEQSLHTAHGVMVGTPLYMSPEQAEHQQSRRRYAHRHLFAGRDPVRTADRQHAAGTAANEGGGLQRDPAADQGSRTAEARAPR